MWVGFREEGAGAERPALTNDNLDNITRSHEGLRPSRSDELCFLAANVEMDFTLSRH